MSGEACSTLLGRGSVTLLLRVDLNLGESLLMEASAWIGSQEDQPGWEGGGRGCSFSNFTESAQAALGRANTGASCPGRAQVAQPGPFSYSSYRICSPNESTQGGTTACPADQTWSPLYFWPEVPARKVGKSEGTGHGTPL